MKTLESYLAFASLIRRSNGVAICYNSVNVESLMSYCDAQSLRLPPVVLPASAGSISYPSKFIGDSFRLAVLILMLLIEYPYLYLPHFSALPSHFRFLPAIVAFFRIRLVVLDDGLNTFRAKPCKLFNFNKTCTIIYPDYLDSPPLWGSKIYPKGQFIKYQKKFPGEASHKDSSLLPVLSAGLIQMSNEETDQLTNFVIDSPGIQEFLNTNYWPQGKTLFFVHPNPVKRTDLSRFKQNSSLIPVANLSYSIEAICLFAPHIHIFVGETIVAFNLLELKRRGMLTARISLALGSLCLKNYSHSLRPYSGLYNIV